MPFTSLPYGWYKSLLKNSCYCFYQHVSSSKLSVAIPKTLATSLTLWLISASIKVPICLNYYTHLSIFFFSSIPVYSHSQLQLHFLYCQPDCPTYRYNRYDIFFLLCTLLNCIAQLGSISQLFSTIPIISVNSNQLNYLFLWSTWIIITYCSLIPI